VPRSILNLGRFQRIQPVNVQLQPRTFDIHQKVYKISAERPVLANLQFMQFSTDYFEGSRWTLDTERVHLAMLNRDTIESYAMLLVERGDQG
jgi:hypothetical protein